MRYLILVVKLLPCFMFFIFSLYVSSIYTLGDQETYIRVYEEIRNYNIISGFLYYNSALSSKEVFHYIFIFISSSLLLDKVVLFSLLNTALYASSVHMLKKLGFGFFWCGFVPFINFYFVVFYFSAERLKFGVFFLILSIIFSFESKKKRSFTFLIFALLSHSQMIVYVISNYVSAKLRFKTKFTYNIQTLLKLVPILLFSIASYFILPQIVSKLLIYLERTELNYLDFFKLFIFFAISFFSVKDKSKLTVTLFYIVILIPVILVGSSRLLFFCFLFFIVLRPVRNKCYDFFFLLFNVYFTYTGIDFIYNVYLYGEGFAIGLP